MASEIRVNSLTNRSGLSTVTIADTGVVIAGMLTATDATFTGNISVGGTATYEDVTNVDSVGVITARAGINVTGGSVGIGTDNPTNAYGIDKSLHVHSSLSSGTRGSGVHLTTNASGNTTNDGVSMRLVDTDLSIDNRESGLINFLTAGTEKLRITAAGNVGIGSDAPSRLLDVGGSISIARNLVQTTTVTKVFLPSHNTANRGAKIRLGLEDGSFGGVEVENVAGSNGSYNSQNVHIINHNGGVAGDIKSLTARFDGRIGIGSDNPQVDLAVRSGKASIAIAKDGLTVKDSGDLHTSYDTLQIGAGGALLSYSTATVTADTQFVHNAYRSSGGTFKYRYADTAARLRVNSPGRTWIFESAANGNADADITFTEQLRIDSGGRIITGNYSTALDTTAGAITINGDTSGGRLAFRGSTTAAESGIAEMFGYWDTNKVAGIIFTGGSDTSNKDDGQIKFYTSASGPTVTERLRINQNGCLQVGEPTGTPGEVMQIRKASGDVEVITYAAPGSKSIFNCTGSNRFALERGYNSVFEIQDPNGNGVRSDLRFDGNIILNRDLNETNNSAVQAYRLIGCDNVSKANGFAIVGSQTDTMSTKAGRITTSNNNGTAWFGPYGAMHPGSYTAMFHMKVSNNSNTSTIIRIDVSGTGITDAGGYGAHRPRALDLAPSHFDNADRYQYVGLDFNAVNAVGSNIIEVRGLNFNNSRSADLYLDHILIVPRIPSHDG